MSVYLADMFASVLHQLTTYLVVTLHHVGTSSSHVNLHMVELVALMLTWDLVF